MIKRYGRYLQCDTSFSCRKVVTQGFFIKALFTYLHSPGQQGSWGMTLLFPTTAGSLSRAWKLWWVIPVESSRLYSESGLGSTGNQVLPPIHFIYFQKRLNPLLCYPIFNCILLARKDIRFVCGKQGWKNVCFSRDIK